ncbi:hypothetical protein LB542_23330 [Mesorhizobium sp. BR1-1-9]|uniref:hypothetical protein n=1 Tax=Mesorhizobium sp. BR1-1-9 TaxID=2876646 RepID=UPI001CD0DCFA|nr:hypothetical protein [Mesorhizobium sp. BR1-1-9]MBZ9873771.1 hypothetical protein [Mesorhizobium sp. BR1-1-9]
MFVRLPRSRPSARRVQGFAWFLALAIGADEIKSAGWSRPSAWRAEPFRQYRRSSAFSASSLLTVSRADLTIIGLPVRPRATEYAVAGLMGGLIAGVLPLELIAETMVFVPFGENKTQISGVDPKMIFENFWKYRQIIAEFFI